MTPPNLPHHSASRLSGWGTYSRESWMPRDDLWKTFDLCSPILCSLRDRIGSFEGLLRVRSPNGWCVRSLFLAIESLYDVKYIKKKILETPFLSGPTHSVGIPLVPLSAASCAYIGVLMFFSFFLFH